MIYTNLQMKNIHKTVNTNCEMKSQTRNLPSIFEITGASAKEDGFDKLQHKLERFFEVSENTRIYPVVGKVKTTYGIYFFISFSAAQLETSCILVVSCVGKSKSSPPSSVKNE